MSIFEFQIPQSLEKKLEARMARIPDDDAESWLGFINQTSDALIAACQELMTVGYLREERRRLIDLAECLRELRVHKSAFRMAQRTTVNCLAYDVAISTRLKSPKSLGFSMMQGNYSFYPIYVAELIMELDPVNGEAFCDKHLLK